MIALKLAFQSLAGLGAIGTICSGAYYFSPAEQQKFTYLVVTAKAITSSGSNGTNVTTVENELYSCHIDQIVDNNCVIYSLNETSPKTIDLKELNSESSKITQPHTFTANKNYLLKVSTGVFSEEIGKTISLKNQASVVFASLEVKHAFDSSYEKISSSLAIFQASTIVSTDQPTLSATTKYFCKIGTEEKIECKLTKPSSDVNISSFSTNTWDTLTAPTAISEIKQDHFYLLEFLNKPQLINSLKKQEISVSVEKTDKSEQKLGTFQFKQLLIGKTATPTDLFFINENHENFLVTSASVESTNQPSKELITDNTKKNYVCTWTSTGSTTTTDASCEIYKLTVDATKKTLSLPWESSKETIVKTKAELKVDELFKLKVDGDKFKNFDSTSPITIKVVGTADADTNKTYATLTTKFKFLNKSLTGKTNLVIGKASATTTDNTTAFNCKLGEAGKKECDIYKFTAQPSNTETYKDLSFASISKNELSAAVDINNFYIFDLKEQSVDLSKPMPLIKVIKTDDTELFQLNDAMPLVGTLTTTTPTINQAIFIK